VNVRFLTIAGQEVDDIYQWFEKRSEGLGRSFLADLDLVVGRIAALPLAGPEIEPEIRPRLLVQFPYAVILALTMKQL
jgi:hypothetical protein